MSVSISEASLPSEPYPPPIERAELLEMLGEAVPAPPQPHANPVKRIEAADVVPFVGPGLNHNDLRLIARLARIAKRGGSTTLMRCLGIAARTPEEIPDTLQRFANEPPPDRFVIDSLEAAQQVHASKIEQRLEPSPMARGALLAYPRYVDLLHDNRIDPSNRAVQYYAIGRIAGMVASASDAPPVQ